MALVDARRRRVDDHEHLGREVFALAVEDDARDVHRLRFFGPFLLVEVERGETVLPVDDQIFSARLFEVADVVESTNGIEVELLGGEQEHGARDWRLADGGLVKVLDRRDLGLRELALERLIGRLDFGDARPTSSPSSTSRRIIASP